jgi:hypothetical protein
MKAGQASVITSKIASEADRLCPPPDTVLRAGHERRTGGHRQMIKKAGLRVRRPALTWDFAWAVLGLNQ